MWKKLVSAKTSNRVGKCVRNTNSTSLIFINTRTKNLHQKFNYANRSKNTDEINLINKRKYYVTEKRGKAANKRNMAAAEIPLTCEMRSV